MARAPSPTHSNSASSSSDEDQTFAAFMEEPDSFRPKTPPPTEVTYTRRELGGVGEMRGPKEVRVGLVSGHPLWGHVLYPAAIAMSRFLELHSATLLRDAKGKGKGSNVVELGAGGGLPGLVAALEGASHVVISDFPDPSLISNIQKNIDINILSPSASSSTPPNASATGFTWGSNPATTLLPSISSSSGAKGEKFDLILLSDVVFNHSQHSALLDSCLELLSTSPSPSPSSTIVPASPPTSILPEIDLSSPNLSIPLVLCFYSHHRPTQKLIEADLGFLSMARARGWKVERVWKDNAAGPAFPEDEGDLCIRSTVHGWALTR